MAKEKDEKKVVKEKKVKKVKKEKTGFFGSMSKEMKEVRWPSFKDMVKYTGATIGFIVVFALFFQLIDLLSSFVKGLF